MAHLVEGASVFPAVSFGPISHALCKLVPSTNRTVASYSARAMKLLLLDDALRPQVNQARCVYCMWIYTCTMICTSLRLRTLTHGNPYALFRLVVGG